MNIEIDDAALSKSIGALLTRPNNVLVGNPLAAIVAKVLTDNEARLASWAREQMETVLAEDAFRREFRRSIKETMIAEACSIGRKAARSAAMAKE